MQSYVPALHSVWASESNIFSFICPCDLIDVYKRQVLGIPKSSTDEEIKKAYRKLAKQYHPDLNPDDKEAEAKFKEVNEAYEVLSDKDKKARYDQFGHAGVDPQAGGGYGGGYGAGGFDFGDIGDIFEGFFGGGFGNSRRSNPNAPRQGLSLIHIWY